VNSAALVRAVPLSGNSDVASLRRFWCAGARTGEGSDRKSSTR
jgi:hypothetical protein